MPLGAVDSLGEAVHEEGVGTGEVGVSEVENAAGAGVAIELGDAPTDGDGKGRRDGRVLDGEDHGHERSRGVRLVAREDQVHLDNSGLHGKQTGLEDQQDPAQKAQVVVERTHVVACRARKGGMEGNGKERPNPRVECWAASRGSLLFDPKKGSNQTVMHITQGLPLELSINGPPILPTGGPLALRERNPSDFCPLHLHANLPVARQTPQGGSLALRG